MDLPAEVLAGESWGLRVVEPEEIKEAQEGDIERIAEERREVIAQQNIDSSLQRIVNGEPDPVPAKHSHFRDGQETWKEYQARKAQEAHEPMPEKTQEHFRSDLETGPELER